MVIAVASEMLQHGLILQWLKVEEKWKAFFFFKKKLFILLQNQCYYVIIKEKNLN